MLEVGFQALQLERILFLTLVPLKRTLYLPGTPHASLGQGVLVLTLTPSFYPTPSPSSPGSQ